MDLPPASAHSPFARPELQSFMMHNSLGNSNNSPLDEGYSEETRSHPDSDMTLSGMDGSDLSPQAEEVLRMLTALPEKDRLGISLANLHTLSNPSKAVVYRAAEGMLHHDPAFYLPLEVLLQIFSYLTPAELLTASTVSRSWRLRASDERLWRVCFAREGWILDRDRTNQHEQKELMEFEKKLVGANNAQSRAAVPWLERRPSKKRRRVEEFSDGESDMHPDRAAGRIGRRPSDPEDMEIEPSAASLPTFETQAEPAGQEPTIADKMNFEDDPGHIYGTYQYGEVFKRTLLSATDLKIRPPIFQSNSNSVKLSWLWLYKQRMRLEKNWDNGLFKTFQIPHPEHQYEGHTECVYTIQHTANWLVSGSRDTTIRVWNLENYRLRGKPLTGHTASVLCLQFDDRPEQDIIISGGSDASVIIWKFSTGEMVQHLKKCHEESVLNLRFDDRYLVTCSKDKTIKVWNRHALERDSPLIPVHVLEEFADPKTSLRGGNGLLIEPYTLLSTIKGHKAAVNAVLIHNNTIVSASGDRTVIAWDIKTGKLAKNYQGHSKGIACVQFDGRRVVSGSSDNTVRIFDAAQQAEVACLAGHDNLVRTVQARFGDLNTVTDEELQAEARVADRNWRRAVANGMQPASVARRSAMRSAGSSRPEDMLSVGANIPPGGGGSRWAKIVSGSYDEKILVWRKGRDGRWAPKLELRQQKLLREMRSRFPPRDDDGTGQRQQPVGPQAQVSGPVGQPGQPTPQQLQHLQHLARVQAHAQQQMNHQIAAHVHQTVAAPGPAQPQPQHQHHHPPAPAAAPGAHPHGNPNGGNQRDSFRLFKLQFDARRLICCSQNRVIVGWDFANGDRDLERVGEWSVETG